MIPDDRDRDPAARWCTTCEEWSVHEARIDGDLSTGEEVGIVSCVRCGTVAERRELAPIDLPARRFE